MCMLQTLLTLFPAFLLPLQAFMFCRHCCRVCSCCSDRSLTFIPLSPSMDTCSCSSGDSCSYSTLSHLACMESLFGLFELSQWGPAHAQTPQAHLCQHQSTRRPRNLLAPEVACDVTKSHGRFPTSRLHLVITHSC